MSGAEDAGEPLAHSPRGDAGDDTGPAPPRYGRYVGLLGVLILVAITVNTIVTKPNGGSGFAAGQRIAPFAVPLVTGDVQGEADVATGPNQGSAGRVPACRERGGGILNVCQLYEGTPLVLALFVDEGACAGVLADMRALAPSFPGVRFAAVSIKGDRGALRRLVHRRAIGFPVGIDNDGALAPLYKLASCPQLTFVLPGGVAQGRTLLHRVGLAALRERVQALVAAARAGGAGGS